MKINKTDLIRTISENEGMTLKETKIIVDALFTLMSESLKNNIDIDIYGFGSFEIKEKKERIGTNPSTHEKMLIEKKKIIKFNPSKQNKML